MNEHLLTVQDGDSNTAVALDMRGYVPSAGASGHVPEGYYAIEVKSAEWRSKKEGKEGKNLLIKSVVIGPEKYKGTPIVTYHPAPTGAAGDKSFTAGESFLKQIVFSIASGLGKTEALVAKDGPAYQFQPGKLVGRTLFVQVEDDEYEGNIRSAVARYITKEEFEAQPGPRSFASATPTGPQTSAAKDVAPKEVLANGTGAAGTGTTQKAVADSLGF